MNLVNMDGCSCTNFMDYPLIQLIYNTPLDVHRNCVSLNLTRKNPAGKNSTEGKKVHISFDTHYLLPQ